MCLTCVGSPYFQFAHWDIQGDSYLRGWKPFNRSICQDKVRLAAQAFRVRKIQTERELYGFSDFENLEMVHRFALYQQCKSRPGLCEHHDWSSFQETAVPAIKTYTSTWYAFQPLGDNIIRGAMYDSMMAYTLPVIFDEAVAKQLPFTDIIDYSKFMTYVPLRSVVPIIANQKGLIELFQEEFNEGASCNMLEEMHKVLPVFQFMKSPHVHLINMAEIYKLSVGEDAFTFTVKAMLRHACRNGQIVSDSCAQNSLHNF